MLAPRLRPTGGDVVVAGVVFAALLVDGQFGHHGTGLSVVGILAAVSASAPLAWRVKAPLTVLALVVPATFLCILTFKPVDTALLPSAVALFSVALYGQRRQSLVVAVAIVPIVALGVGISDVAVVSGITLQNVAWALLALAAGDALRSRRAIAAEREARQARDEREREREAERRLGEERLRIAREVHDVVAHSMVAINVQAGVAAHVLDQRPEQARTALVEIKRVSGAALTELRATLGLLRDDGAEAPTRPTERLGELPDLAASLRAAGLDVKLAVAGSADAIPPHVGAAAYRIVQEALTNVLRHAEAQRAEVRVGVADGVLELEVLDDGVSINGHDGGGGTRPASQAPSGLRPHPAGFAGGHRRAQAGTGGNGLRGMRERADALGGVVEAGHRRGGGWQVRARLPLARPS